MKIRDTQPAAPASTTAAAPQQKPLAEPADKVASSAPLAQTVAVASKKVDEARAARLEEIKEQVKAGTYKPDPQRIAASMLDRAVLDAQVGALAKDE